MMHCPMKSQQEAALLLDYCAGKLPAGAARDVERHMAECATCAEFVSGQQALWSVMNKWDAPDASAGFDRRLKNRLREADSPSWLERVFGTFRPAMALAALCLLMAAGALLQNSRTGALPAAVSHTRVDRVDPEQVEKTLDDMQMLRELSSAPGPEAASPKTL